MQPVSKIGISLCFFTVLSVSSFGSTRYIAQSAGVFTGGAACNGQITISATTWNGTTNSPGDVNYICGTLTFSAGSSGLVGKGSGTSSSPIRIIFDKGAVLQSPAFGGTPGGGIGGALVFNNVSYWTVDGQNVGTVQNTADGTPGQTTCISGSCTVNANTVGIWISNATGITVQNLTVRKMYMDMNGAGSWGDAGYTANVWIGGPSTAITLAGSTFNDAHTGIWAGFDNGSISGLTIGPHNTVDHHAWGISWANGNSSSSASSTGSIYDNSIGNFSDWNLSGDSGWHTDGIITYTYSTIAFNPMIYNNYFYGDLDGGTGAATAHISVGTVYGASSNGTGSGTVFNNVIDMTTNNGHCSAALWDQGVRVAFFNNVVVGRSCTTGTSIALMIEGSSATIKNNIFSSVSHMIGGYGSVSNDITSSDHNVFFNCFSTCFGFGNGAGPNFSTLSAFQSGTGLDANSSSADPKLSTSFMPQPGSSAVGLGANLTTVGIAPLDLDRASVARPASGSWDTGAYQDASSSVAAPTGLTATVQ